MIGAALRRLAAPRTITPQPSGIPELTHPAGVAIAGYDAIIKNPAWTMDTTGAYRPAGEMPPEAVWVAGSRPTVIMVRAGDVQDEELLPGVCGEVRIGRRGKWQTVPAGWRFVTPEWAFRDLRGQQAGSSGRAGDVLSGMTIDEFIHTVSAGRDRVGTDQVTPYEFGTDLRLDEYRAEQQQIADDDKERPKGVSSMTLAVLGGILVAMLIFAPQSQPGTGPATDPAPQPAAVTAEIAAEAAP